MKKTCPSYRVPLPKLIWVYLPLAVLIYPYALHIPGLDWEAGLYREYGLIENLTALFLVIAMVYGIRLILRAENTLQRIWFFLFLAGVVYFLGEEISWGQHLFGWNAPENWSRINMQRETNIHNLPGVLNTLFCKAPRQILSNASILGGLLIPFYFIRKAKDFPPESINHWIWPSYTAGITAILANLVSQPAKIAHTLHGDLPWFLKTDYDEVKECYLALFILLYALTSTKYLREKRKSQSDLPVHEVSSNA